MRPSLVLALVAASIGASAEGRSSAPIERVIPNDNRVAAGRLRAGTLTLHLESRLAEWHPDGDSAPGAAVPAFAEEGGAARIPGPLVRVPAGTIAEITLRNRLEQDTLVVFGLHARTASASDSANARIALAPGEVRAVRFALRAPGTYYYWGTTTRRPFLYRHGVDAQLTGAIVVDPAGVTAGAARDRILVMGMWTDTISRAYTHRKRLLAVINGVSFPHGDAPTYSIGDTVRWRVINASTDAHPMHLHGFYFRVDARGDNVIDTAYAPGSADHAITQNVSPAMTMALSWVPERAGNWLFHCHIPEHFAKRGSLGSELPAESSMTGHAMTDHTAMEHGHEMGGLVMGVHIVGNEARPPATDEARRRQIRLLVRRNSGGSDASPFFGYALQTGGAPPPPDSGLRYGPPIVLTRGEPVSITVVNQLGEPTAVHWHGIELESYYDGVPGFSGAGRRLAPAIAPGDSFVAMFTPPRAGTFIYHTHFDEERQQLAGLAGPIVVMEPGARHDDATDRAIIITTPAEFADAQRVVSVDGRIDPAPLVLRAGVAHRLRFINMTVRRPTLQLDLMRDSTVLEWRLLAADGAALPGAHPLVRAHRLIALGETFDVEVTPDTPGDQRIEIRIGGRFPPHPLMATVPVRVVR